MAFIWNICLPSRWCCCTKENSAEKHFLIYPTWFFIPWLKKIFSYRDLGNVVVHHVLVDAFFVSFALTWGDFAACIGSFVAVLTGDLLATWLFAKMMSKRRASSSPPSFLFGSLVGSPAFPTPLPSLWESTMYLEKWALHLSRLWFKRIENVHCQTSTKITWW